MGYGLDGQGSIPGKGKRFLYTPQRPDQLWGPPGLLSSVYRCAVSPGVKRLEHEGDHSPPVPRSRMVELYLHSPIRLNGVVLNRDDLTFYILTIECIFVFRVIARLRKFKL
jgi:hypothetical protein